MIQATEIRKAFGSLTAVDGISFEVQKGETFGLLGPNGAGKSTTINMLVGALAPDAGRIMFDGRIAGGTKEAKQLLGVAPQALALYEDLTAEENLGFFGAMYGLSGA
ncbi:MAG TPA: ATP-binding cassette domain-containing protein, partial [Fimbriimonadaceae bacterium]|nr:ATP-binding cassette domain-containing protein [Fimbriimonadaceae bacterium]